VIASLRRPGGSVRETVGPITAEAQR